MPEFYPEIEEIIPAEPIQPGVSGADDTDNIIITNRAIDTIKNIISDNSVPSEFFIRLGTSGGGCSGMNFLVEFDNDLRDTDIIYDVKALRFVADRKSVFYLMGVTLDYMDTTAGMGFIFKNPNNIKSCGCGF